jgi:hypothetical protein
MRFSTIAATAENLVYDMQRKQENHPCPEYMSPDTRKELYIGPNPASLQRRVFEWAFLATSFRITGQLDLAEIAKKRVDEYMENEFGYDIRI